MAKQAPDTEKGRDTVRDRTRFVCNDTVFIFRFVKKKEHFLLIKLVIAFLK